MSLTVAVFGLLILGATRISDSWLRSACRWVLLLAAVELTLFGLYDLGFQFVGPLMIGVPG